jgi:drug/metabolite transporter (DMT)-like permease
VTELSQTGRPSRAKIVLAFGAIYIIWGSTYLAIRFAVQTIPPFWMAGARFLLAGSILYTFMRSRGTPPPLQKHWLAAAAVGALLLVGGHGSLVWAEQRVPSGLAATLVAVIPLWMVLLDSFRKGGPKLTGRVAGGLAVGLAGVGILVGPARLWGSSRVAILGTAVLMFSAFCWSGGSLYSRGAKLPSSPFLAAAMEMLAGGAMLMVLGVLVEGGQLHWRAISLRSTAGLIYLVVFGSLLSFTAYIWLLRMVSTSRVATYAYVNPVVAVFFGWAVGGEAISARGLLATGIIVAAVALILSHRSQPGAVAPETDGLPTSAEERAMGIGKNDSTPASAPGDPVKLAAGPRNRTRADGD